MTKLHVGISGAVLAAGLVACWVLQRHTRSLLEDEVQALRSQTQRADSLLADNARLSNLLAQAASANSLSQRQLSELLRLRGEVGQLRQQVRELEMRPSASVGQEQVTPFVGKDDYSDRVGLVMRDALDTHGFSVPWIVVRGSDGSLWFVAERFQPEGRFDRIAVQVRPDERVTTSITPYQQVGSGWPILGYGVVDVGPEAELIAAEIGSKLGDNKDGVGR
jgi:hypothetical protein